MDQHVFSNENEHLQALLKRHKLWEKKSPFEHKSLLKALSNALFLTRNEHEYLQKRLLGFFLANVKVFAREFRLLDFDSVQSFVQEFYLPQYQNCLLQLCSKMTKTPIELYHPDEKDFRIETFGRFPKPPLRIIRLYDGHYSALFPLETRVKLAIGQNFILNIVERAITNPNAPFKLEDRNGNQFENYEYREWLENSVSNENFIVMETRRLNGSPKTKDFFDFSFGRTASTENVGSRIIFSLQNRKAKVSQKSEQNLQFDPDCEKLLADLERAARKGDQGQSIPPPSPQLTDVPKHVFEEFGEILFDPCDSFSYRDVEEILWKDGRHPADDIWGLHPTPQPTVCRTKSVTLEPHTSNIHWTGSSDHLGTHQMPWRNDELADPRMLEFRTIEVEEEFGWGEPNTNIEGTKFKKAIKPSASESLIERKRQTDLKNFSMDFIQPFPVNEEQQIVNTNTPQKQQSKKKKKGESKVYRGFLKFFDEKNSFGFLSANVNGKVEDVFVYRSEFDQAGIEMTTVRLAKHGTVLTFEFNLAFYFGKYQRSKKALNLRLVEVTRNQE